jgi:hypothetical protein
MENLFDQSLQVIRCREGEGGGGVGRERGRDQIFISNLSPQLNVSKFLLIQARD